MDQLKYTVITWINCKTLLSHGSTEKILLSHGSTVQYCHHMDQLKNTVKTWIN